VAQKAQTPCRLADHNNVAPLAPLVEGFRWLNSDPLDLNKLAGRVRILVFWSFACEASLVRLRQVQRLAAGAGEAVVPVAVHTPRYEFEEDAEKVMLALAQHRIEIPVLHDPDYVTWNRFNPEGWPATVVIDGNGRVVGSQQGTANLDVITEAVTTALTQLQNEIGSIKNLPPVYDAAVPLLDTEQFAFPTSAAHLNNGDVVVADSGNDRLVVLRLNDDRVASDAVAVINEFTMPGSIAPAADGQTFYVAEPSLGRISHVDLEAQTRRLCVYDLVSPSGLTTDIDGSLVVTDAGAETIYRVVDNPDGFVHIGAIAGAGWTGAADGPAADAELAQPSGIVRTEAGLVFCDGATNRLRLLTDRGKVTSVTNGDFLKRGLVDGPAHKALMQRPSDLAMLDDGAIVVADTGNSRLRRVANRRVRTLGAGSLNHPRGLCILPDGHLLVCDTFNHRIVVVAPDLASAWPLEIRDLSSPVDFIASNTDRATSSAAT